MSKFVYINDDPDEREQWLRWARENNHRAWAVESALAAVDINADYYVFDISAIAPMTITNPHLAYSPICSMIERHPGAEIIILSAVGKHTVEAIIEEVYERTGIKPIYGGWGTYAEFEKLTGLGKGQYAN